MACLNAMNEIYCHIAVGISILYLLLLPNIVVTILLNSNGKKDFNARTVRFQLNFDLTRWVFYLLFLFVLSFIWFYLIYLNFSNFYLRMVG